MRMRPNDVNMHIIMCEIHQWVSCVFVQWNNLKLKQSKSAKVIWEWNNMPENTVNIHIYAGDYGIIFTLRPHSAEQ